MQRKLVKQGRNALTVTLPAQWTKQKGLTAGDVVSISENGAELLVSARLSAKKSRVEVDGTKSSKSALFHLVIARYIEGYDEIVLLHDSSKVALDIGSQLIGMVVERHTATSTVYRSIVAIPEENFEPLLARTLYMLQEQARLLPEIVSGILSSADVKHQERLLDSNILYCMRYLTKYGRGKKSYRKFLLCSTLEHAGDQISAIAKVITSKPDAETILRIVEGYVKYVVKKDFAKLHGFLRKERTGVGGKSYVHGQVFSLIETLYNNIGFFVG
jgi:phosphate uptake regulator